MSSKYVVTDRDLNRHEVIATSVDIGPSGLHLCDDNGNPVAGFSRWENFKKKVDA